MAPAQVKSTKNILKIQKLFFMFGMNFFVVLGFFVIVKISSIRMDRTRLTTPPSLFGIDRKIA